MDLVLPSARAKSSRFCQHHAQLQHHDGAVQSIAKQRHPLSMVQPDMLYVELYGLHRVLTVHVAGA